MTTDRKSQKWDIEEKWFSSSEAARYLSASVDKVQYKSREVTGYVQE